MKKRFLVITIMLLAVVVIYLIEPFGISGVAAGAILASMLFYITGELILTKVKKY